MSAALQRRSAAETRHLLRTDPDQVLFPVHSIAVNFGFPPEALRQELESGRLASVAAGIQGVPCVSGKAFIDWLRNGQTPGVLKDHVLAFLAAKKSNAH
jgi:hypothetical protein